MMVLALTAALALVYFIAFTLLHANRPPEYEDQPIRSALSMLGLDREW